MGLIFVPSGLLDISTDPADLPGESSGPSTVVSESMQRLKNLRVDQQGQVSTRDGSDKVNESSLEQTAIHHIREQAGVRYTFAGTRIYEDEDSIQTGMANTGWSSILYNSWNSAIDNVFALNGTDRKRIEGSDVYEWGLDAPTTAVSVSASSGGSLTGDYNAKFTLLRLEGSTVVFESNPSDAGTADIEITSGSLMVHYDIPQDNDQYTQMRLYRTLTGGGALFYLDVTLDARVDAYDANDGYAFTWEANNVSGTSYKFTQGVDSDQTCFSWEADYLTASTDNDTALTHGFDFIVFECVQSDGNLGALIETDHNRPPLGTYVAGPNYDGSCFIAFGNLLYFCKAKRPEYWPLTQYVEVTAPQFPIQLILWWNGQAYAITKRRIHYIQGTGANTFFPLEMESVTGAQGPQGAIAVQGHGIFHVGTDGIYLYSNSDRNITQAHFRPIFRGETVNGIPGADSTKLSRAWLIQHQNRLYFGYASADDTYPEHVLVFNLDNNRVAYYTWGREIRTVTVDELNGRLLAGDNSGFIWEMEKTTETKDAGTAIAWGVQSKDYTLSTRAHFPREVKYDVDASDENCSATGELILDGSTLQSHTITGDRVTRPRLVATGNGQRASLRITGEGPVTIYQAEAE